MQTSIWRTIPKLRNPLPSSLHSAQFHSTPILLGKSNSNKVAGRGQKPSKAQVRFAVRQKRSDTKRALKDFLLYGKSSKHYSQDDVFNWTAEETDGQNAKAKDSSHGYDDIPKAKSSGKSNPNSSTHSVRGKHKTWRRKQRFDIDDDDVDPGNIFTATFGGQKCYTWSFTWTENLNFNNTWRGFDFGNESKKEKAREKFWNESDFDEDEEPTRDVGCHAHRVTLGLPTTGPLKLDDIKSAFRASALKWHPDKHQGSSQSFLGISQHRNLSRNLHPNVKRGNPFSTVTYSNTL